MADDAYEDEGKHYDAILVEQTPEEIRERGLNLGEFHFTDPESLDTWLRDRGGSYEGFKAAHDAKIAEALESRSGIKG